jgi:hypothetical protein
MDSTVTLCNQVLQNTVAEIVAAANFVGKRDVA